MTEIKKQVPNKHVVLMYDDSIKSRWTARHTFSSKLAFTTGLDLILNIGSYNGWLEATLLSYGRQSVVSIDIEQKNIRKAKQAVPQADFVVASAVNLPFREQAFQLITMYEVIEHIPKGWEKNCLGECNRVLHDGGALLLSTPFNVLRSKLLDPAWYLGHRHYSATQLAFIGRMMGFVPRKTYIRGGLFEQFTVILLYIFKNFGLEIPFKTWFESRRLSEYEKKGFSTIFIVFGKQHELY
jgi:2-polyprenyl-3-methyl-5-hydroxy-6-metoxy-1,4-benzoquinol methylase